MYLQLIILNLAGLPGGSAQLDLPPNCSAEPTNSVFEESVDPSYLATAKQLAEDKEILSIVTFNVEDLIPDFESKRLVFDERKESGHHWCTGRKSVLNLGAMTLAVENQEIFVRQHADGLLNWRGNIVGKKGRAISLIIDQSGIIRSGRLQTHEGILTLDYLSGNVYSVSRAVEPPGGWPIDDAGGVVVPPPENPKKKSDSHSKLATISVLPIHFDLLTASQAQVETNAILNDLDDAFFANGITGVNLSLAQSATRIYHQNEFASNLDDLFQFAVSDDVVEALRKHYGADLIMGLTKQSGGCALAAKCIGQAHQYNGFSNSFLSMTDVDSTTFTGTHEFGHNFGANHSDLTSGTNRGATNGTDDTVMFVPGSSDRIAEFSTDDVGGIGDATRNNEAEFEGSNPGVVAGFQSIVSQPAPTPSGLSVFVECGSVVDATWTSSANEWTHHTLEYSTSSNFSGITDSTNLADLDGFAKVVISLSGSVYFRIRGELGLAHSSTWVEATNDPLTLPKKNCSQ